MSNKGLKPYTKQQVFNIGNINGSVNLYSNDANLNITLPIFKTVGYSPIDLSLIYNQQNSNELSEFGYGFKLNLYKNLDFDISTNKVTFTNSDGSIDTFTSDDYYRFENSELNQYINRDYEFEDETLSSTYYFETYDKVGNLTRHTEPNFNYPEYISAKSGEYKYLYFDSNSHITTINNNNNDNITFTKNNDGLISTIVWKHSNVTLATATLVYTSSRLTSLVVKNKNNVIINDYTILYSTSSITLKDNIMGNIGKVILSGNAVTSIKRGIGTVLKTKTNISYSGNKTTVTDELGNIKTYIFDNSGILRFEIDNKNNVISYSFDKALMKYIGSTPCHINDLSRDENLLKNISIDDFIVSGTNLSKSTRTITDEFYQNLFGDTTHYISGKGTLNKRITGDFKSTDIITFVVWCRQVTPYYETNKASVTLTTEEQTITKYLDKTNIDSEYYPLVLGMVLEKSSRYIDLKIELIEYSTIMIAGMSLLKKGFGAFYEYDINGNVISKIKGRKESNFTYNSNNRVSEELSASSARYKYKYDSKNNITEILGAYQVKETNVYDSKNRITKTTTHNYNSSSKFEVSNNYTSDYNATNIDELLNDTNVISDDYGNITRVTNALNEILDYNYSNENRLIQILLHKNNNNKSIEYTYDVNHHNHISTVTLSNGTVYSYTYDSYDRLIRILCNGEILVTYTYDNYDRVTSLKYGSSGEIVTFTYDTYSDIISLSIGDTNYSYEYNDYHQLVSISANNNVLKTFEYDLDGKVIKVQVDNNYINYCYDNLDNINEEDINIEGNRIITSHSSLSRSNGCNPESLLGAFDNKFMNCLFIDNNLVMTGPEVSVSPVVIGDNTTIRSGIVPCYSLSGSNSIKYYLMNELKTLGTFGLWIKPHYPQHSKDVIAILSDDGAYVKVSVDSSYKLFVQFRNSLGEIKTIISTNIILNSEWTFIGLNWLCNDGVTRTSLIVNGEIKHYQAQFEMSLGNNPMYIPGDDIIGNIAAIMSSYKTIVSTEELMAYYRSTNDYIIFKNKSSNVLDFSNTTVHDIVDSVEIFPLQNNVKSLNGIEPVKFDQRVVSSYDRDRTFNYNYSNNRYAYVADGGMLEYDLNILDMHTIGMNIYLDTSGIKQTIFEYRNSYYSIGLFVNNSKLFIDINGFNQDTGLIVYKNKWTFVGLAIKKTGLVESDPESYYTYALRVFKDNEEYITSCEELFELYGANIIVGRKYTQSLTETAFSPYYSTYPLLGQIEMMISKNSFCSLEEINSIRDNISLTTISTGYNEFGLEIKKSININYENIMTKTNSYKNRSDDSGVSDDSIYKSSYIKKEEYSFNDSTLIREYELDELGNITSISNNNSMFNNHIYEYDYRGYLIRDNNENYQYDDNGNITLCGTNQYEYTNVNKDKLTKACGYSIIYDTKYSLNPKSWNGRNYNWLGRRLTRYEYNNIITTYQYNEDGLRKSKTVDGITTNYFYDGKKLITEINPSYRLDFLYDENNILFGFIYGNNKYFYVRDQLCNIIGIIDLNGNIVVQYDCNAYGNNQTITGNTVIGNINPFRYKGYYYDKESGMYYCKSRYYNPMWCRWLNADSVNYLNIIDINGTNLYQYCSNNPVMYIDPSGHFAILAILIAVGIFVVDTIVETSILMNASKYKAENVYQVDQLTGEGNVSIPNSAAFNNPIAQLIYSNYLYNNVKNPDGSNFFTGDPYDLVGEWQAHNFASISTGSLMILGFGPLLLMSNGDYFWSLLYSAHSRSVRVDIGPCINSETRDIVRAFSQIFKWISKIITFDMLNW